MQNPIDLTEIPFPVAYPLHWARDPGHTLGPADQWRNAIFTAYQAMKLTTLLLLADYLEADVESDKHLAPLIRGLRFPHWQEWAHLADGLARFWTAEANRSHAHFPALAAGWMSVSRVRAGKKEPPLDPVWAGLLDAFEGVGGRAAARSANDAVWELRNRAAHREGTITGEWEARRAGELPRLLAVVEAMVAVLFTEQAFRLLRAVRTPGAAPKIIDLHGPHPDLRFVAHPPAEEWAEALRATDVAALTGDDLLTIYPLLLPWEEDADAAPPMGLIEPVTWEPVAMMDGVSNAKLSMLGVREAGLAAATHLGAALAKLRAKHADLLMEVKDAKPWTVAVWGAATAQQTLEEMRDRKYFPAFYVSRAGIDHHLNTGPALAGRALLLLGEAGSGKSSLLARFIDTLLNGEATPDQTAAERVAETEEVHDIVAYLAGRADYAGSGADDSGTRILADAVARKLGIREGSATSLENLVLSLSASTEDTQTDRKFWIVLDGLNEAERFRELVVALDQFLPTLALAPRVRLIVSMRSGAFFALAARQARDLTAGAEVFATTKAFLTFPERPRNGDPTAGPDAPVRTHPWLEIGPFTAAEAEAAYDARRRALPERAATLDYRQLSAELRDLMAAPLYLHLFHDTWAGRTDAPGDLDEGGLLDAYLHRLTGADGGDGEGRLAGIGPWLARLGDLMLEQRAPLLPMAVADAWAAEWTTGYRAERGLTSAERASKLDPIEELTAASVLLRPAEEGLGAARERIGYGFVHQKLAERVLLRALARQIEPRLLPERADLLEWTNQAAGPPVFAELAGALRDWVRRLALAGAAETLTMLLDVADDAVRGVLIEALILAGSSPAAEEEAGRVLQQLADAAVTHPQGRERFFLSVWSVAARLEPRVPMARIRPAWRALYRFAKSLAEADQDNVDFQGYLSGSCDRLGDLALRTGQVTEARDWFTRAYDIRESLAEADRDNVDFQWYLSGSCDRLGDLALHAGRVTEARDWFTRAYDILKSLAEAHRDNVNFQWYLSVSCNSLGGLALRAGQVTEARDWFTRGYDIRRTLAEADRDHVDLYLVGSCDKLGDLALRAGQMMEARDWFARAYDFLKSLAEADRDNGDLQSLLAVSCDRLGDLAALRIGQVAEARDWFTRAYEIHQALAEADRDNVDLQSNLAAACDRLGDLALRAGQVTEARDWFTRAYGVRQALVEGDKESFNFQSNLAASCNRLGDLALRAGQVTEARDWFTRSFTIADTLVAKDQDNFEAQGNLSISCVSLGDLARQAGQMDVAEGWFHRSFAIGEALVAKQPDNIQAQRNLLICCIRLGDLARQAGQEDATKAWFRRSFAVGETLLAKEPTNFEVQGDLSYSCIGLGDLALRAGRPAEARDWLTRAYGIHKALAESEKENVYFHRALFVDATNLAAICLAQADLAAAEPYAAQAMVLVGPLLERMPDDGELKSLVTKVEGIVAAIQVSQTPWFRPVLLLLRPIGWVARKIRQGFRASG